MTQMTKAAFPVRLLIVETDDDDRIFLRRRLGRLGYEVTDVAEPAQALALVSSRRFNLAMIGLHGAAGVEDAGLDLVRRIREIRPSSELPIMAVAGGPAAEDASEVLAAGADDCLSRPLYVGLAHARIGMLLGRPPGQDGQSDLMLRLENLDEAAARTEAVSAMVAELGHQACAPLNALLGAASVLTRICDSAEMKPTIAAIETSAAALDLVIVRALGRPDRRNRAPKPTLRVLLADNDAGSRLAVHGLLNAAETSMELVEAATGLEASLALDTGFFDLIVMNLAAPEATAGMLAIRRLERSTKTRRTPLLAFGEQADGEGVALGAGADLYVPAPLTAASLLGALAEALVREAEDVRFVA
jgi:CheY-like chemotaxis protein